MEDKKTEKLYERNAYTTEFVSTVQACLPVKDGFDIVLAQSAFYPEGGGQPGDHGCFSYTGADGRNETMMVLDTKEKNGVVLHRTEKALAVGTVVEGKIDWKRRFDHMQNHSGEHIVSGLIHGTYGYQNVGFHMGSDMITIDFDGEISYEELKAIEAEANHIVWENRQTQISLYDEESVKAVEYRSKKELHGIVRIVTFPDADTCACCGTHVANTGEIGLIKLVSIQKFKAGVRIEMLCGARALQYVNRICEQNREISVSLSAKPLETANAVLRMKENAAKDAFRLVGVEQEVFEMKAKCYENAGDVLLFENDMSPDSVRKLTIAVMEACKGRCIVLLVQMNQTTNMQQERKMEI